MQIHIWTIRRIRQLPRKLYETKIANAKSSMHVFAPYCNDANDFSLEELELILKYDCFTSSLGTDLTGNIFQCMFKSGWVDCESYLDIISEVGSETIKLVDERKIRRKIGIGFEIWTGVFQIRTHIK